MAVPHDFWLILLSIAIAVQGSFVGLSLAAGFDQTSGFPRRLALAGSALTLATGIWSMHFVGLLAASFPSAVDYLALPTLLSFLICVIVVGVGVYAAVSLPGPRLRIGVGAVAMGLGISAMHYVGMSAVHLAGPIYYNAASVLTSVTVAICASAFALIALGSRPNRLRLFLGATVLGLAIAGMHYTAMAGMTLDPLCYNVSQFVGAELALSRNTLALLATFISFGVSSAFLLSLVPDTAAAASEGIGVQPLVTAPAPPAAVAASATTLVPANSEPPRGLVVEKEGRPVKMAPAEILVVRANAHYTFIHNGEQEFFCSQSIGALEAQLGDDFARVHRSYLVRLDRVTKVRRSGEAWMAELDAAVQCSIPVARGHSRQLKARLDSLKRPFSPPIHELRQQT